MAYDFGKRAPGEGSRYERPATPEVLTYGDIPTPVAARAKVRVRLEASGVNPADVGRRGGASRDGIPTVFRTATARGSSIRSATVSRASKAGQRVWLFNGQRNGRASAPPPNYIALSEHLVTPLPDDCRLPKAQRWAFPP